MNTTNSNNGLLESLPFNPGDGLVNRVSRYLDEHPEISREEFLREALEREINVLEEGREVPGVTPTPEDIRDHAWIEEGLSHVRHHHRGFGERIRGLLSRDR